MRPIHFVFVRLIWVSTLMLAQNNPASIDQNHPGMAPSVSRFLQRLPSGSQATRKLRAAVHQSETPQVEGLNFANPIAYPSGGNQAVSVAVADVNGDGKLDLIVANYCGNSSTCPNAEGSVGVLLGNGDGTFQAAVVYDSGGVNATSLAVADVNGDGIPDLVVANSCADSSCANGSVSVLPGNGNGTFRPAVAYDSGGSEADSVAVADVNGDGTPDLVVLNSCASAGSCETGDGSVGVLLGNGSGTFQSARAFDSGGVNATSVAVADVNGDGKLDVVVSQCAGPSFGCIPGEVGVLLGNGDGTFRTAVNYSSGADFPSSVAVADVNGDGKLDLLVGNPGSGSHGTLDGEVGVLLGNGDGTFQTVVAYDSGGAGSVAPIAVADVNGDGKLDLVVGDQGGSCVGGQGTVAVLLGNGDGTFQAAVGFCSGGALPSSVALADLNGHGKLDLLVANESCLSVACNSGVVGVLVNTVVLLSPTSLAFGNQAPETTSAPQTVTLTNTGEVAIDITSVGITGSNGNEFSQTNTCGTLVPAGQGCSISVTFTPTGFGNASASLNVSDNIAGSPQTVALTGSGNGPAVSLSPSAVSFPSQYVGTSGLPQTVTLTNNGTGPLTISSVNTTTTDFGALSSCSNPVAVGGSCSIGVFFDPTASGTRSGALTITDNASGSPQSVALIGTGEDFSMGDDSQATATVTPGQSATYMISVAPGGGFKQTVTLNCSGAPVQSTCSVSPSSITLGGVSASTATVSVTTTGNSAALSLPAGGTSAHHPAGLWVVFTGTLGLALLMGRMRRRQQSGPQLLYGLTFLGLLSLGVTMSACGGGVSGSGGGGGTPAGTYALTVTGSYTAGSTTLTHNTKLTLVVQ